MTNREKRAKQLQDMTTTSGGRAEIVRLVRTIRGVGPGASLGGMFIGQMIADILAVEFPDAPPQQDAKGTKDRRRGFSAA